MDTHKVTYEIKSKNQKINVYLDFGGARWPRAQSARRAIAEVKQRLQKPVIGWVTKIYNLELLRALEGP
jgi:hypothetical protein